MPSISEGNVGIISNPGEIDILSRNIQVAGLTYEFEALGLGSGFGTLNNPIILAVYDPDGNLLPNEANGENLGRGDFYSFTAPVIGEYTYEIGSSDESTGTYVTNTWRLWELEINSPGEVEVFSFSNSGTPFEGYTFSYELRGSQYGYGTLLDPEILGIYDENGILLNLGNNNNRGTLDSRVDFILDDSGETVLEFTGSGGTTGTFIFADANFGYVDDFSPGNALSLGSISIGVPSLGEIEVSTDRDRFEVFLEANQIYSISLDAATASSEPLSDPAIIGIYDDLNNLLPGTSNNDGGPGLNAQLDEVVVETSGLYEIEVGSNASSGIGRYELTVASVDPGDDYLPGEAAEAFGSVLVDVPTSGVIESEGDRDRFDVTLQAGVLYNISLEGSPTGGGSLQDPEIMGVFDSNGQRVAGGENNDGGVGANALVESFLVNADGTYQIEVASAVASNFGDYRLTVEATGFVDDFLPGIAGGFGSIAINGRAIGEIETSGDIDGFRVTLQGNTTYEISILGRDSNNGTLIDPDLVGIFSSSNFNGAPVTSVQTLNTQFVDDDNVSYFTPQSAGEYFVGVQDEFGGTGTYAVAVNNIGVRDDFAADIDTTGAIQVGSSAVGRINFAQDEDWFEVNLSANRLYEIELVPTGAGDALADPFFRGVYDSNGILIQNTDNDDSSASTSSSLQFVTDTPGTFYLSAGGFRDEIGQYRLELNDLGPLDDNRFDITIEFSSDDVPDSYVDAFQDAVERWEEIIIGDLNYGFVEGYGFVDDILIEVAVEDIELQFEGVDQTILAISTVLDQRSDSANGVGALPTYSRIVLNSEEIGALLNLDELAQNTIGRALGFGSLWEEFGLVRNIEGVATYTGPNALREIAELSDDLNGQNVLEDGEDGALAGEYWSEANLTNELMTSRVELRGPSAGPGQIGVSDNPISALTVAAMEDLGYEVDYGEADLFSLRPGASLRQTTVDPDADQAALAQTSAPQKRLLADLPDNESIPNGAALIYVRPNEVLENSASFTLNNANSQLLTATGTNAVFIEAVTGETLSVELKGTFAKNNPASVNQLSGTVDSMDVYSLTGLLLFSVDYSQSPVSVTQVMAEWPSYSMDDANVIIVDTLPGTLARINPNGGGDNANRIFAGANNDFVRGGDNAELINGGPGNDTLEGQGGNDVLEGGGGNDTAVFSGDQSSYTLQFSPSGTTIMDRRPSQDGTDTLVDIESLHFADDNFNIGSRSGGVELSAEDFAAIVELYIAYFNRAPAAKGLLFWAARLEDGVTLPEIAQSFFEQAETQRTYEAYLNADGGLTDTEAFVTAVFNNVLGRDPSGPYWINELDNNPNITPAIFILSVLNGVKGSDVEYIQSKTDIGVYFSAIKGLANFEDTVSVMGLYDGTTASVNAAVASIDQIYDDALAPISGEFLMPLVGVIDDPFAVA